LEGVDVSGKGEIRDLSRNGYKGTTRTAKERKGNMDRLSAPEI
jgi:hypothetical protein